jgi:two-component system response regulator NreC
MTRARPIRVLLADDHTLVRAGLRKILEAHPEIEVVGEVASGAAAVREAEKVGVDVLVLDLTLPDLDGFEVLRRIQSSAPKTKVLVLTMHADREHIARAIQDGAHGYLLKDSAAHELVAGIEAVAAGRAYYSSPVQSALSDMVRAGSEPQRAIDQLTERELEVLRFVAEGLSTKEVASQLGISGRTVESHRANVMRKLGLRSVARLTQFAIREGLLRKP